MSCRVRHRWHKIGREDLGNYWLYNYGCRGCAATKQEYRRKDGSDLEKEEEGTPSLSSFLTVLLVSVLLGLLAVRGCVFIASHTDARWHTIPNEPEETTPINFQSPYWAIPSK